MPTDRFLSSLVLSMEATSHATCNRMEVCSIRNRAYVYVTAYLSTLLSLSDVNVLNSSALRLLSLPV
jgi:hypothetical protein